MALSGSVNTNSWVANDDGQTRYYTLSWTATQSVTNNTSTISWTLKAAGTETGWVAERTLNVSIAGSTVYSKTARVERTPGTIDSGTITLTHNAEGAKSFAVTINAAVYGSTVNCKASKTFTLDTIPRKSTLSVANGTLGTSQTLTVTRQSTNFTHSIKAVCGSSTLYIKADGSTSTSEVKHSDCSIPFTPPLAWASQNTTGTSVSVKYTITTYSGSTNVGNNAYSKTCSIPASVKPSCTVTVTDPTGIAAAAGVFIKGVSKFKVVVTPTTAYGSAISSYKTTANGSTYTSSSFTTGLLTSYGALNVSATVTDKRGRTGTTSTTITVVDYFVPKITSLKVKRCNEDGTENDQGGYVKVTFSGAVDSIDEFNISRYTLEYKKSSETTYVQIDTSSLDDSYYEVTDASYIFEADTGSSYDIKLSISDEFNTTTSTTVASTAFSIIHWLASGLGIAFGKIAELTNVMDIAFQIRFMGGILHPVLEPNTDLNDIRTPNTYVGANVSTYAYGNCPLTSGTFTLEVKGAGENGQVHQIITYCSKNNPAKYERVWYGSAWGSWIRIYDTQHVLWSGAYYMHDGQTITLDESITSQVNGVKLIFSLYSTEPSAASDAEWVIHDVPKYMITNHPSGGGYAFSCNTMFRNAIKYLYITDTTIRGHADNDAESKTIGGITYTNKSMVLRYVLGY